MRIPKLLFASLIAIAGFAKQADAHLIESPVPLGFFETGSSLGDPTSEALYIESLFPGTSLTYFNKYDYPGKNSAGGWDNTGALASSLFTIDPLQGTPDPEDDVLDATVGWNLTGTGFQLAYVLVKDGRQSGDHVYSLYGVSADQVTIGNGTVTIIGYDKGISHISFFGVTGVSVPEGGATLAMLGAGLTAIGLMRRLVKSGSATNAQRAFCLVRASRT